MFLVFLLSGTCSTHRFAGIQATGHAHARLIAFLCVPQQQISTFLIKISHFFLKKGLLGDARTKRQREASVTRDVRAGVAPRDAESPCKWLKRRDSAAI
jgi:hypothetical protein